VGVHNSGVALIARLGTGMLPQQLWFVLAIYPTHISIGIPEFYMTPIALKQNICKDSELSQNVIKTVFKSNTYNKFN